MKALAIALALVVGVLSLSLVWANHSQIETIALLREQNALLWSQVQMERRLSARLKVLNTTYGKLMGDVGCWLGLKLPKGLGGP